MIIRVDKPDDLQALFERATSDADKNGIAWTGDIKSGHGSGRGFEGTYTVDADGITIYVSKKPPFITKARVEMAVKTYISLLL